MELDNFISPEAMLKDVGFTAETVTSAFISQASLFSYYAAKHARAERQEARAKHNLEIVEAILDKKYRKHFRDEGVKFTETVIANEIIASKMHREATDDYIDAKQICSVCKAAVEAFRHRKDMLIQVGADSREEKKGALRMLDTPTREISVSDRATAMVVARNTAQRA